ncbi:MAG: DUF4365 domain-containing protein [Candidatus Odinarchaeota archaeon]
MRIRSHILEEESRTFLKTLLPDKWVLRNKPLDYGIDCEVEIFDQKGYTTGQVFWIQIKATDSENESNIRSIRLPNSKIK